MTGMGIVVAGGICAAVLATRNVGRRHSGSRGTRSASRVSDRPGVSPIPSAGGPIRIYDGAPDAGTGLPVQKKRSPAGHHRCAELFLLPFETGAVRR